MKTEDRRIKLTKRILKEALVELMRTKPVHEISIKKICDTADVNRSTFYHHYRSPQELYDDIINDIFEDLNLIFEKDSKKKATQTAIIADMLSYVEENRSLFLVILNDKSNSSIGSRLAGIVEKFFGTDNDNVLLSYCTQFISAGVVNILCLWLSNENRLPPKEVAGLITTIIMHGVKKAVVFSSNEALSRREDR